MKKTINFFKWLLTFPIIGLAGIYLFWLITAPMEIFNGDENFGNFTAGLIIFFIYVFLTIRIYALNKIRNLTFWLFVSLLLPILAANIMYLMNFSPHVDATEQVGVHKYYVSSSRDWDLHILTSFYKCKRWSFICHRLYSSYGLVGAELLVDKTNNEVSLLNFGGLMVTDGEETKYYTGISRQLGDKLYILSWDWVEVNDCGGYSCRKYIYTLNTCNLDYLACNRLPIRYTETYDISPYWEADEITQEITLYGEENGAIIFTYGKDPRCYAKGCEILQESTSN